MTPQSTWSAVKADFALAFPSAHHTAVFLGTILAYPLHAVFREEFGMIPAAWLFGRKGSGKTQISESVHCLYHPDPVDSFHHFATDLPTQPIIARLAAYPYAPWTLDEWCRDAPPGFNDFMANACDAGRITRGTYGTSQFKVTRAAPPIVAGESVSADPALTSRYLHFIIGPATDNSPSARQEAWFQMLANREHYHLILSTLLADRKWQSKSIRLAHDIERSLTDDPHLPIRRRFQFAIAAAVFTAADQLLSEPSSHPLITDHCSLGTPLPQWLASHRTAFNPVPLPFP